jgi:alpha-glucosidase
VYQGEELGLPDAEIPPDRIVDVDGRDPERAPIPWEPPSVAGPGAGFTTGSPWLPLVGSAESLNAASQADDPRSTLSLFRRLAALRASSAALQSGSQTMVDAGDDVLAWERSADGERLLVAVNFSTRERSLAVEAGGASVVLSTDPDRELGGQVAVDALTLAASEAVVVRFSR